jgi:hypothetical protein
MIERKHIEELLERFMRGATTVDEENELAQYFRSSDVPEEWQTYKEMFAWFDAKMPEKDGLLQKEEVQEPRSASIRHIRWYAMAVAAAVALTIIMCLPKLNMMQKAPQSAPNLVAKVVKNNSDEIKNDSSAVMTDSVSHKKTIIHHRRSKVREFHEIISPGKLLMAKAMADSATFVADEAVEDKLMMISSVNYDADRRVDSILLQHCRKIDKIMATYCESEYNDEEIVY